MHSPELIFSSGRYLFYCRIFFCRMIGGFPPIPLALGDADLPPILVGAGELLHAENGVRCDDDKHFVGDGVVGPFGLGLGVFEVVYVFGDALTIEMVPLHLVLECEDIKGMDNPTHCLGVGNQFPCSNEGILRLGLFEFADPGAFNNAEDKLPCFYSRLCTLCNCGYGPYGFPGYWIEPVNFHHP